MYIPLRRFYSKTGNNVEFPAKAYLSGLTFPHSVPFSKSDARWTPDKMIIAKIYKDAFLLVVHAERRAQNCKQLSITGPERICTMPKASAGTISSYCGFQIHRHLHHKSIVLCFLANPKYNFHDSQGLETHSALFTT